MEPKEQELQDLLVEDQVRRGWSVVPIPESVHAFLVEAHAEDPTIPTWPAVRFHKLTHKMRRDIATAVQRKYNADLQDAGLLSTAELMKLTVKRGEWSLENDARIEELQQRVGELMRGLSAPRGERHLAWTQRLNDAYQELRKILLEAQPDIVPVYDRWANYDPANLAVYSGMYAPEQGGSSYSHDADYQRLAEQVPFESIDLLEEVNQLTDHMRDFLLLNELQAELRDLSDRRARIFAESIENRREMAESMIRLEALTQWADKDGKPQGPIKGADGLPTPVLDWLLVECHFFLQGVPQETREYLQQWGFLPAPQESGSSASSDASPAEPPSKPAAEA